MKRAPTMWLLPLVVLSLTTVALATQYSNQIIAIMDQDQIEDKVAQFLYEKNPGVSTVMKWNRSMKKFDMFLGIELDTDNLDFSKTRIQVIGHGGVDGTTLDRLSPDDLAEALSSLYPEDSRAEVNGERVNSISRISLVGCNCAGANSNTPPEDTFAGMLITKLKEAYAIDTSISARTTLVYVDSTGKKLTGTPLDGTMVWENKNPTAKKVFTLDEQNNIVTSREPVIGGDGITCRACGVKTYGPVDSDKNGVIVSVREDGVAPERVRLTIRTLYGIIEGATRNIFDDAATDADGNPRQTARVKRYIVRERTGEAVDTQVNVRKVRQINSLQDLVNEINYFGRRVSELDGFEYYRFGDYVMRMDKHKFYFESKAYMGVILNEVPADAPDDVPEKFINELIAQSKYRDLEGDQIPRIGEKYREMTGVDNDFFSDMRKFMDGKGQEIIVNFDDEVSRMAKATNGQRTLAMTLSESIRNFQTHIVNMMALDLNAHGFLSHQQFFDAHPMARGGTWPAHVDGPQHLRPTGFDGSYGAYTWDDLENLRPKNAKNAKLVRERSSNFLGSWLSNIGQESLSVDGKLFVEQYQGTEGPTHTVPHISSDNSFNQEITNTIQKSLVDNFHVGTIQKSIAIIDNPNPIAGPLVASRDPIETPEVEVVDLSEVKSINSDSRTLPLVASETLKSDQELIAHQIATRVQQEALQDDTEYSVVQNSVEREENEIHFKLEIHFKVIDKSEPPEEKELSVGVDEEKLGSDDTLDDIKGEIDERTGGRLQEFGRGLAVAGTVHGLFAAVGALEDGNTKEGVVGLAMAIHGIGGLSGINKRVYRSAGKVLGNLLHKDAGNLASDFSKDTELSKTLSAGEEEFSSVLGREEHVFGEDIPFVGIGLGIYNIYEDFSQHTVIGDIDGVLDSVITGLDIFGAATGVGEVITEPLSIALTVIRMFIDDFYSSIKNELDSLPPGANVGQKICAFFRGVGDAISNILEEWTLPGQIFAAVNKSHELNNEYNKDRELLRNLSNYRNYFSIAKESGTPAEEINFANGVAALNGGDITFRLGDSDYAHIQLQEIVDENGQQRTLNRDIPRDSNLQDIVMGIGESHSISFKRVSVKIFWFIPVDTKTVISKITGDRSSLHGTYYGNSQNNRFFAIQERPPKLDYQLEDYYYALYGQGGNDTFYLGPQHTYVEGNEGEDTYYINQTSTHTDINNFAHDQVTDYLITTTQFSALQLSRTGYNLHITSSTDGHNITIFDWFRGVLYQHMNFKSGDGILFWVTVDETGEAMTDPYAWTKADSTKSVTLDLSQDGAPYESIITLVGSNFSDVLTGNDKKNQIVGGGGSDVLSGGEGQDTYTIDATDGSDTINNFALDEQQDFLFFGANHNDIRAKVLENNICIYKLNSNLSVTIQNWFDNSSYQHLLLASNDAVVSQISNTSNSPKLIRQLFVDMELLEGPKVLNMSSDEISVIGSSVNDTIFGNNNDNYFTPGKGDDYIEGGEGPDLYVIRPGEGNDIVYNLALDEQQDTILFGAAWMEIQVTAEDNDLILSAYAKNMSVRLLRWFEGENFQHLIVRSKDEVVFALPNSPDSLVKTPIFVDRSKATSGFKLDIKEAPWRNVTRVSGSPFDDAISGNNQSNFMDPGPGQAFMRGRDGHDTYVIKAKYNEGNRIHNTAEDQWLDTLLFLAPYSHIVVQKRACSIELSSNLTYGNTSVLLADFMLDPKEQHLMITSSDGISFVLPESTDYQPVPLIINLAKQSRGQVVNLTTETQYTTVRTVYGSTVGSNHLVGNAQNNTLVGGNKPDMLFGKNGNDVLKGGGGNDVLSGGPGNDVLEGGNGNDTLQGGDGDDTLAPGTGQDVVDGGNGTDCVVCIGDPSTAAGSYMNLEENYTQCNNDSFTSLNSIECAYGSTYNDFIIDNAEDNLLFGGAGNDTIIVSEGYDVLQGGPGHDIYHLTNATGTKIIVNFASDLKNDVLLMPYANKSSVRYSRSKDNLIVRMALVGYPEGFFDATKPTLIISKWYQSDKYKHIEFQMSDGVIIQDVIEAYASQLFAYAFDTQSSNNRLLELAGNYIGS